MDDKDKINLLILYAHADADKAAFNDLKKYIIEADQLSEYINPWTHSRIPLGSKWDEEIKQDLEKSDIVILVISQAFLNSGDIKHELEILSERSNNNECLVIPLFFERCDLSEFKFSTNQGYPSNDKFIKEFTKSKISKAFTDLQQKILAEARKIISNRKSKASRNPGQNEKSRSKT